MEDLQTYRARIGLYRHHKASKQKVPAHKLASYRQREQKRRQDQAKLKKTHGVSTTKLNPVATPGKVVSGITHVLAVIIIAILLMAGFTSGHMESSFPTNVPESHVIGKCFPLALQQNYDLASSTGDCLLGNAGVHMYNGNPRTPVRDNDAEMDSDANADSPSAGPSHYTCIYKRSSHEMEGTSSEHSQQPTKFRKMSATQSTVGQEKEDVQGSTLSERAEKIQQLEINIREKHSNMIKELNGYISPKLPDRWKLFQNGLTPYLTPLVAMLKQRAAERLYNEGQLLTQIIWKIRHEKDILISPWSRCNWMELVLLYSGMFCCKVIAEMELLKQQFGRRKDWV